MDYLIGIDGGGTRTRAAIADTAGRVLGIGYSQRPSTIQHAGEDGMRRAFSEAVDEAFKKASLPQKKARAIFLGIGGVVRAEDRDIIRNLVLSMGLAESADVDHDVRIANTGGLDGVPGIALIAGTGSSCYGRRLDGHSLMVGGWGSIADDAGSGGWVGLRAINLAVRQADGRLEGHEIKDAIFKALGISMPEEVLHRLHDIGISREEIAALCPIIADLSKAGNHHAQELLNLAASELALLVSTTARRLEMQPPEVVLAGGFALSGEPFQAMLEKAILASTPGARIHPPKHEPVIGALIEAAKLANISDFKIQ